MASGTRPLSMLSCISRIARSRLFMKKGGVTNDTILVSLGGNLGDFLMATNGYIALIKHFTAQGKRVCFCCPQQAKTFMALFPGFDGVDVVELSDAKDAAKIMKAFRAFGTTQFEKIIIFGAFVTWESLLLVSCLQHNESWLVMHEREAENASDRLKKLFFCCYTDRVVVPLDMQQQQREKLLLERIGVQDFCVRIYPIPKLGDYAFPDAYITVAVDSSRSYRRWDAGNFIELVRGLEAAYGCDVYITGSNVSEGDVHRYEQAFADDGRVKMTIGKLDLRQWIELIRGSRFHIGLDSGSIHVAAAVGTKCFCLCGVWAGHRVMPYVIDEQTPGTIEPICIYRQDVDPENLPCYGCVELNELGRGNERCSVKCRAGMPCQCLEMISVEQVLSIIKGENIM